MKKIFLLFIFLFAYTAQAQIKVVQNEKLTKIGSGRSVALYKKKNQYTFNYQDVNSTNLNTFRSFSFKDINKDFDGLYKMISNGFISMPSDNIILELPRDILELHFARNYGQVTVQFVQYVGKNRKYEAKSEYLTKKEINKLFGKKNTTTTRRKSKRRQ